nr:hypothetical protein BaRGS_020846 [Batillaria attramentaria]
MTELDKQVQETRTMLAELLATLRTRETVLEQEAIKLDQELLDVEHRTQETMTEIDEVFRRLRTFMDTSRCHLERLQHAKSSDTKESINRKKAFLLEQRGKLSSLHCIADRVGKTASSKNLLEMSATLNNAAKELQAMKDVETVAMTTVQIDQQLLVQLELQLAKFGSMPILRFHTNHGKNIRLSNYQQTAERVQTVDSSGDGIVVSCAPMETSYIYEVVVDRTRSEYCYMVLGVIGDDPASAAVPSATVPLLERKTVNAEWYINTCLPKDNRIPEIAVL